MKTKKMLAALLTVLYVVTMVFQLTSPISANTAPSAAPYKLGETWGFEDGKLPGTAEGLLDDGFVAGGTVEIVSGGANGSNYAAKIAGNGSKIQLHIGGLTPNTAYQISAWVKGEGTIGNSGIGIADSNANDTMFGFKGFVPVVQGTEWVKVTLDYTTGDGVTYALLYAQNDSESTFLIDDICMKDTSSAAIAPYKVGQTWGFEEGKLPGTPEGLLDDGFVAGGTVEIVSGGANGSNYAAKIAGNGSKIQLHIGGLTPNTTYQISAWVKGEGTTGISGIGIADSNANDTMFGFKGYVPVVQGTEWVKVTLDYTTGDGVTYALLYAQNESDSTFLIDDICMKDTSHAGIAPYTVGTTWGFEEGKLPGTALDILDDGFRVNGTAEVVTGGANATEHAVKVSERSQMHLLVSNLQPETTYQISAWVKGGSETSFFGLSDCNANGDFIGIGDNIFARMQSVVINSADWTKVSVDYKTGKDVTHVLVYMQNDGDATFLLDDFTMKDISDADIAPYKVGQTWGFEEGKLPGTAEGLLDDGFVAGGTVEIVSGGANGSNYAAKIAGNGSKIQLHIGGLTPNTAYQISAWVKGEGTTGISGIGVADSNATDTKFDFKGYVPVVQGTEWVKVTLDYTTGDGVTYALIYAQNDSESIFLLDDFTMQLVENEPEPEGIAPFKLGDKWGFEEGELPGTVLDILDDGFRVNGTAEVVTGGANATEHAVKVSERSQMHLLVSNLQPETTYQISAWVKGGSETSFFGLSDCDANGDFIGIGDNIFARMKSVTINGADWTKVSVDYKTGKDVKHVLVYMQNDGDATFLLDDFTMQLVEEEPTTAAIAPFKLGDTWGFEEGKLPGTADNIVDDGFRVNGVHANVEIVSGGANDSNYAAKIDTKTQMHMLISNLQPETTYRISAWVKGGSDTSFFGLSDCDVNGDFIGVGDNIFARMKSVTVNTTEWTKVSVDYKTGKAVTRVLVYVQNDGNATFLFDDFTMELVEEEPSTAEIAPYKLGDTWGFEEGKLPGTADDIVDDGFRVNGAHANVEIVSGGANNSKYAAKIDTKTQMHLLISNLQPKTTYRITAWVKGGSDTSFFGLSDCNENGDFIGVGNNIFARMKSVTVNTTGWTKVSVDYTTGANVTRVLVYAQNDGDATFLLDDFSMVQIEDAKNSGLAPYKLGQTWGFEDGLMPGTMDDIADDGFRVNGAHAVAEIVSGGANGSKYAMKIDTKTQVHLLVSGLQPKTTYRITAWVKGGSDASFFGLSDCNANGDLIGVGNDIFARMKSVPVNSTGWTKVSVDYTTGANVTRVLVYAQNDGNATFLLDNFSMEFVAATPNSGLAPYKLGQTWDFEDGLLPGTSDDIMDDGFRINGVNANAEIVSGGANGSKYAAKIDTKTQMHLLISNLQPKTTYRITAWVKGGSDTSFFGLSDCDAFGNFIGVGDNIFGRMKSAVVNCEEWTQIHVDYTTGSNVKRVLVYVQNDGDATFLFDDFSMQEIEPIPTSGIAPYQLNDLWDFEDGMLPGTADDLLDDGFRINGENAMVEIVSGGANDSKYALKIDAKTQMHLLVSDLQPETSYVLTAWVKGGSDTSFFGLSDCSKSGNLIGAGADIFARMTSLTVNTEDWMQLTVRYTTGANITNVLVYAQNDLDGTFLIDDIQLVAEQQVDEPVVDGEVSTDIDATEPVDAQPESKSGAWLPIVLGGAAVAVLAAAGTLVVLRRKKRK